MQAISFIILIWVYAVSVYGFLKIFSTLLKINYDLNYFSIIISSVGVVLGLVFYKTVALSKKIKNYILIGVPTFILILIISIYIIFGVNVLVDFFTFLLKILVIIIMCIIPTAAVYSILNKQRSLLLVTGTGILFFFFLVIILSKVKNDVLLPLYSENQVALLILFFVLFLCFLELGTASIFFKSATDKMTLNKNYDNKLFLGVNRILNRYIANITIVLSLCYILSLLIIWSSNYNIFNSAGMLGVDFSSVYGVLFLISLTLAGAFILWYLVPREKQKPQEE